MSEETTEYKVEGKRSGVKLEPLSVEMIMSFMDHCSKWELDNVSFYLNIDIRIHLTRYKSYWELLVKHESKKTTDIYKVNDTTKELLSYDYTEND